MQTNDLLKLSFGIELAIAMVYLALCVRGVFEKRYFQVSEAEIEEFILNELHLRGDSTLDEIKSSLGRMLRPNQLELIISKLIQEKKITSPFKRNGSEVYDLIQK